MSAPYEGDSSIPDTPGLTGLGNVAKGIGVGGQSGTGNNVIGIMASGFAPDGVGVIGVTYTVKGYGVLGVAPNGVGVAGSAEGPAGIAVMGTALAGAVAIYGTGGVAGKFDGNVQVNCSTGQAINANCSDPGNDCINATSSAAQHAGVSANNSGAGFGLWASSPNGCAIYGQSNNVAAQFNGTVNVNGTLNHNGNASVSGTMSVGLDILLSAQDCAEDFDLGASIDAEPGAVMVLTNGGELEPSSQPYDKRVAGVISGAGAYRPGLILGRYTSSNTRAPVALIGKVYCKVDADYGRVEVGDLLTTSATPGHAMKATDPLRALGTVIGKALRPLDSGRALIPILVALQ
jgi:hypothetical protein